MYDEYYSSIGVGVPTLLDKVSPGKLFPFL